MSEGLMAAALSAGRDCSAIIESPDVATLSLMSPGSRGAPISQADDFYHLVARSRNPPALGHYRITNRAKNEFGMFMPRTFSSSAQ